MVTSHTGMLPSSQSHLPLTKSQPLIKDGSAKHFLIKARELFSPKGTQGG